jgi:hypothetical protein
MEQETAVVGEGEAPPEGEGETPAEGGDAADESSE